MELVYTLQGLDCPHCSAEIERAVGELEGVTGSAVNLMQQTLTVHSESLTAEHLTPQIEAIVRHHEPDVAVIAHAAQEHQKAEHDSTDTAILKLRLAVSALLFCAGLLLTHLTQSDTAAKILLLGAYLAAGYDVILTALRNIAHGKVFDEHFLMTVSTVGAFCIGEFPEAAAIMLLYQTGELFQSAAVQKSRRTISALLDIRPDTARLCKNGETAAVRAETVPVGAVIEVRAGERIPLDGTVLRGSSMLDTAALTGESVPRRAAEGDAVLSGAVNLSAPLTVEVTKAFGDSTASRIILAVENAAARKAPAEQFITKFARYYTPVVVACAVLLGLIPPLLLGADWAEWIRRACVFLIISCPCAVVLSVPLTFFGGIGAASARGVLVKGSNYLEALSRVTVMAFDKTGTLTEGSFRVTEILPAAGYSAESLLSLAAHAERQSQHPIAQSVCAAFTGAYTEETGSAEEIAGCGIRASVGGKAVLLGNARLMEQEQIAFVPCGSIGTKVYAAVDGQFAGCIVIADALRPDAKEAVAALRRAGIRHTVMLTGDNRETAEQVAQALGIDEVHAELLPEDKVAQIEALEKNLSAGERLAFAGDGINDAPVLARADVGIAMGALGADAAIEAADVVLMTDEPMRLTDAIGTARRTKRIVAQNLVFVLGVKLVLLILGAFGIADMWSAVFGDVGVTVLAVLNAMRMLAGSGTAQKQ